jgi:hypothetical protein
MQLLDHAEASATSEWLKAVRRFCLHRKGSSGQILNDRFRSERLS